MSTNNKQQITVSILGGNSIQGYIKRTTTKGYVVVWDKNKENGPFANEEAGEWFPMKSNKVECFV